MYTFGFGLLAKMSLLQIISVFYLQDGFNCHKTFKNCRCLHVFQQKN